jgi:hypothetical protein
MELRITLAPDGGLRLLLPTGRGLNIGLGPSSLQFIRRILLNEAKGKRDQRGYIGEFPTQHILDIWRAQDTAGREEATKEAAAAKKAEFKELGIDLDALDIRL